MKKILIKTKSGFTIIEIMVSISVFLVVVMAGMTALLNANLLSQKSRDMRSIMDSLNFAMEDMSRNIRTGYDYHCFSYSGSLPSGVQSPQNCGGSGANAISFKPQDFTTNPLIYYFYTNPNDSTQYSLFKVANGSSPVQITPNNILLNHQGSFIVTGAVPGDGLQPHVTIKLSGSITYNKVSSPFSLQTSVSQRLLDNK